MEAIKMAGFWDNFFEPLKIAARSDQPAFIYTKVTKTEPDVDPELMEMLKEWKRCKRTARRKMMNITPPKNVKMVDGGYRLIGEAED